MFHSIQRRAPVISALALALCTLSVGAAHAADPMTSASGGNLASGDRSFVEKATIGGMTEIQASKLAQEKGSAPAVKEYAQHMITEHTEAAAELTKIASAKSVTPPGTLDSAHKKDVDKLSKLSGADFDKAYVKQMVADHKTTVSLFEKESKSGKDADLQAFAGKTLPKLQEHLQSIQGIQDKMK